MPDKPPKVRTKPVISKYAPEHRVHITATIDKGIAYAASNDSVVKTLIETVPQMNRARALALIAWRKRSIAITQARLVTLEDQNRGELILRLECVYALAMERGDVKGALSAAKELGILFGVSSPQQSTSRSPRNVTHNNVMFNIPDSQLDSLNELTDAQLRHALAKQEVSEPQAQFLVDSRVGLEVEEDDATD